MIGDPVALTIRRNINRPPRAILDKFAQAPSGFVTDAFNGKGSLHYSIKPLRAEMRFCGPAITAFCGPMDNLAAMAVLDFAQPGDVIVIATAGNEAAAVIGDLWALWAKRIGVAAIVCDGLVRDLPGLLSANIPIFAKGYSPNAGYKNGPGEVNLGVTCGGIYIGPGDIVVGDQDGVVAVPRDQCEVVAERLVLVNQKEADAMARVQRGEKLGFWDEKALASRNAVRYVD